MPPLKSALQPRSPGSFISRLCLWFGVSVPLVFLGSFFGFRKAGVEKPGWNGWSLGSDVPGRKGLLGISMGYFTYIPEKTNMANGKSTIFNRRYIFKWWIFH